ncbi:ScbA/BarX family gamma-butyrolactone biosynthesis protein [Streptomyces sp. NPDC102402]|uniref:ScbA/BarX family gamma-butyrolactone biosynthesis protein n=1 Tax=Streptomyces sp. NPDC102402 TaxID=3366169 RepID=UPI00382B4DD2
MLTSALPRTDVRNFGIRPVTPAEVHKADASEQLLTGWRPTDADRFTVSARWGTGHRFYGGTHGHRDPLLLIEGVRQAIPLLCHSAYGVPFGFRQAWEDLRFSFEPSALAMAGASGEAEFDVVCSDVVRRGPRVAGMTMTVRASLDGVPAALVRTRFSIQPPAVYRRLRGPYADLAYAHARALPPGPPVPASLVGREEPADVVLSATSGSGGWYLRPDLAHPVLFDHPVDHAPGMLLLEAARQAALAGSSQPATVLGMKTVFTRYAEFDTPCLVSATAATPDRGSPTGTRVSMVTVEQNGRPLFDAEVTTLAVRGR